MAQNLAANQIVKLQIFTQNVEQVAVTTFHYKVLATSGIPPTLEQLTEAWYVEISSWMGDVLSSETMFLGARGQIVQPLPMFVAVQFVQDPPQAAAGGAGSAPRQASGLISWKTILAGPGGRGRTFTPFPPSDMIGLEGHPTADFVTKLGALATAIMNYTSIGTAPNTADLKFGIKSSNSAHIEPVTNFVAQQKWATMHKRGDFGAPNTSPF